MAVYKNRFIWEGSNDVDTFIEIECAQVVLQQRGDEGTDILVIPKSDVPKLIEYLQLAITLPELNKDV